MNREAAAYWFPAFAGMTTAYVSPYCTSHEVWATLGRLQ